jgi:hypothetical protein
MQILEALVVCGGLVAYAYVFGMVRQQQFGRALRWWAVVTAACVAAGWSIDYLSLPR